MPTKHPRQCKPSATRSGQVKRTNGLALDDFLTRIERERTQFQLSAPRFGLEEMERYPRAREALEALIQSTIDRHGTEISSRPHPVLSDISTAVYLEPLVTDVYSGLRISPKWILQVLAKLLE